MLEETGLVAVDDEPGSAEEPPVFDRTGAAIADFFVNQTNNDYRVYSAFCKTMYYCYLVTLSLVALELTVLM